MPLTLKEMPVYVCSQAPLRGPVLLIPRTQTTCPYCGKPLTDNDHNPR